MDLKECMKELYEYAVHNGFNSDADDQQALMEMIFFMTQKSASGDTEAEFLLGKYILATSNAKEDIAFASQLLSDSALQGYGPAKEFLRESGVSDEALTPEDDADWDVVKQRALNGDADAQYQIALSYMPSDDGTDADLSDALEWFAKAAENGHQMAAGQLRFWTYVNHLMDLGEIPCNAAFMEIMQTVIGKAENGDEEARKALE